LGESIELNRSLPQNNALSPASAVQVSLQFNVTHSNGFFEDQTAQSKGQKAGKGVYDKLQEVEVGNFTPLKDKLTESFFEDQDSSEDEGIPDYKIAATTQFMWVKS